MFSAIRIEGKIRDQIARKIDDLVSDRDEAQWKTRAEPEPGEAVKGIDPGRNLSTVSL